MVAEINIGAFAFFNSLAGSGGISDAAVLVFANGTGILLAVFTFLLVVYRERQDFLRPLVSIFAPAVIAFVYAQVLKELFYVPRPSFFLDDVMLLFEHGGMDSFPSGHATAYSALAFAAFFYYRRLGAALLTGAVLVGVSRVISGVHWPLDILGGFVVGASVVIVYQAFLKNTVEKMITFNKANRLPEQESNV